MRSRWLTLAVAISVALNLFFVGLFSASAFQRAEVGAERPGRDRSAAGSRQRWQRSRPFEWMSEEQRSELRPRRKGLRAARREAAEALRAEPFEPERLRQALGALRHETDLIQASVHEYMLRRAASMSAEERRRLADNQLSHRGRR